MDSESLLKFVKSAVEDEQKVVTYKWLSIVKNVAMSRAKMVLQEFVNKEKQSGLNVYLCLIGYKNCDGQKTIAVKIINEEEKESALKNFVEVSSHVYSVQRSKTDMSLLYSCDYDTNKKLNIDNRNLLGIVCNHVVVRSRKKSAELTPAIGQQNVNEKRPAPSFGDKKKSMVGSFFSKQRSSKAHSNNSDNSDSGFVESKSSSDSKIAMTTSHFVDQNKTKGSQDSQDTSSSHEKKITEPISKIATTQAQNKSTKLPANKKNASNKFVTNQKGKRKRVIESSESDDGDSYEEPDQSIDLFESTPPRTELASKSTPVENSDDIADVLSTHNDNQDMKENKSLSCGTNLKKVTAVKTYVDSEDEGFMVTERVLEAVQVVNTGKQNDIKVERMKQTEAKPEVTKKLQATKKKQPVSLVKQSTISSFFSKK